VGADLGVGGLEPFTTPADSFYRIDTALSAPRVNVDTWKLKITGMVDRPLTWTFDELVGQGLQEHWTTLCCVSNEVGGRLISNARWGGVLLDDVLELAGVQVGATQIVGRSVDGWTAGFPTEVARDGRPAMIAVTMNSEPLPVAHGFPARLVVPGLYGYVSATKWLAEIELTTWEAFDAYWIPRGWSKEGPVKTQSRIDVPRPGSIPGGKVPVAGVAWAQHRGIERVEVQVDDGPWNEARLGEVPTADTWRQWVWEWDATPGSHVLQVRATDADGALQTPQRRPVMPDGATGYHRVLVQVGA
jgi:DMSO/TMAO reductase YedYZ molybdopterin-dependent catalytic subunit